MNAQDALETFLQHVLTSKKDRYIGFISKPKNHAKFLNSIYHELEEILDSTKKVDHLNERTLAMKGYKFEPNNIFGEPIDSLGEACKVLNDSFLVVSEDGKFAIYGPETFFDSRAYYAV